MLFNNLINQIEESLLKESRWSDSEYRNPQSPWRLTLQEYLQSTNKKNKMHSLDSYEPQERRIIDSIGNPITRVQVEDSYDKGWKKIYWWHQDGSSDSRMRVSPSEVSTEKDAKNYALNHSQNANINWKTVKQYHWQDDTEYNSENYSRKAYPYKIETLKNGIEIKYKKKPYLEIAAFDNETPIAIAFDEWGALLIQVSEKYRNQGIGKVLSRLWNSIKPTDSGGFTPQGLSMKKSLYKQAVKQAQEKGWYEKAIQEKILTPEKIQEIIKILKEK